VSVLPLRLQLLRSGLFARLQLLRLLVPLWNVLRLPVRQLSLLRLLRLCPLVLLLLLLLLLLHQLVLL
jgi:hypothetical protein